MQNVAARATRGQWKTTKTPQQPITQSRQHGAQTPSAHLYWCGADPSGPWPALVASHRGNCPERFHISAILTECANLAYIPVSNCKKRVPSRSVHNFGTCQKPQHGADLWLKELFGRKFVRLGIRHCAAACFLQVPKLCTDLYQTLLYILIFRTYTRFVWKNRF